jgi:putative peptide zinc metalloprotease protein
LIHGYLFFRIPLAHPNEFVQKISPFFALLNTNIAFYFFFFVGVSGFYSVIQEWDLFLTTVKSFYSFDGALMFFISLSFLKILHEFGHAIVARWNGCTVGSMGIAFLVLFPVLYTDVTDSWRLKSQKARLSITLAGIKTELIVTAIALFSWSFMTPGYGQSICVALVVIGVMSSLFVNLSPFMRFDGYFALSDYLGIPNLQNRSFSLAKTWLGRRLFGLKDTYRYHFSDGMRAFLISYAFAVWVYRFFLFLGIAILVYSIDFKALGIFLFVVEIYFFIFRPVMNQLIRWFGRFGEFRFTISSLVTSLCLLGLLFWAFMPAEVRKNAEVFGFPQKEISLYPALEGEIVHFLSDAQKVQQGALLAEVKNTLFEYQLERAEKLKAITVIQKNRSEIDRSLRVDRELNIHDQVKSEREIEYLKSVLNDAKIVAPFDGRWIPNSVITLGGYVNQHISIGTLYDESGVRFEGYVVDGEFVGSFVNPVFVPDDGSDPLALTDFSVDQELARLIKRQELADVNGGPFLTRASVEGQLAETPIRSVNAYADLEYSNLLPFKGFIQIHSASVAPVERLWNVMLKLLNREAGF